MRPPGGPEPTILAFDTSRAHVSGAVFRGVPLAARTELTERGQAERLLPLLAELLDEAGTRWADLDLIAVGTGPGNFTGTRISVAAARGMALGLAVPAMGVSMFEAILDPDAPDAAPPVILSLEAPRGQAYVQPFRDGRPQAAPRLIDPAGPPADLWRAAGATVRGFCAETIARHLRAANWHEVAPSDVAERIARIAAIRWHNGTRAADRPAPLYVRPADASPPADPPPAILP